MKVQFKVLSHACLLLKTEKHSIIIDPWLLGSCYWRSWWNFPKANFNEHELLDVDAVIISHIHWDHWHSPTLKKYFKNKDIIIPDEPGLRSERDLRKMGFKTINRIKHGKKISIGDIDLSLYQFGLLSTDAAIVIEAGGIKILNANDAKLAGLPLNNLVKIHGKFDFALRSHSSANPRICYQIEGEKFAHFDDQEHYFRSYKLFMDAVNPRYAIPFASNHCHLHKEVYKFNSYITNPVDLERYLDLSPAKKSWKLIVMMPGSEWNSDKGFILKEPTEFRNKDDSIENYLQEVHSTLEKYYDRENNTNVTEKIWAKFLSFCSTSLMLKRIYGNFMVTITRLDGFGETRLIEGKNQYPIEFTCKSKPGLPNIIIPAIIFKDAVRMNMFEHAGISKRCKYIASNNEDMNRLIRIVSLLEKRERFPRDITFRHAIRFLVAYVRRWRELLVYTQAFYYKYFKKLPLYLVEEEILKKT